MKRRTGMTLVEVLVAIFIMGIGLIALLTLFPIGVLRMAQAIRDDRCASAAMNARDVAIIHDLSRDAGVITAPVAPTDPVGVPDMFKNPYPRQFNGNAGLPDADPYGEGYPVFVDPIGYYSGATYPQLDWVGGALPNVGGFLRRRDAAFIRGPTIPATNTNVYRWFSLFDDTIFEGTMNGVTGPGTPKTLVLGSVQRDTRYTWAYLLRRPQSSEASVVDCSIVVFESRPLLVLNERIFSQAAPASSAYFDLAKNTVLLETTGATPPDLRAGGWILDNSFHPRGNHGSAHGAFYRVVAIDNIVVPGTPPRTFTRCELQQPLKGFTGYPTVVADPSTALPNTVCQGTAIIMEGVAEVVDVGPVRLP